MKHLSKKVMSVVLVLAISAVPVLSCVAMPNFDTTTKVSAQTRGNLATHVTGHWSYWDGSQTVVKTNESLLEKLPTRVNQGTYRFTTDNYDSNYKPFMTNKWDTSFGWNYSKGDAFGNVTYAIPLSYFADKNGMTLINPFARITADKGTFLMSQDATGYLSDFTIGATEEMKSSLVDNESAWSSRVRMPLASDDSKYLDYTLTHGSPFMFGETNGISTVKITSKRNLPCDVTYMDNHIIVLRHFDNGDDAYGLTNYDYYAVFLPDGATANTTVGANIQNSSFTITLPSDDSYFSFAWLCDTKGTDDSKAQTIAQDYEKYAYNIITDTNVEYAYDAANSEVRTTYHYSFDAKNESTSDKTIMGVIPHQYKNMSGYDFLDQTSKSIRGTVKFLKGNQYTTVQKYTGILPGEGSIPDVENDQIKEYVANFMEEFGPTESAVTKEDYEQNTYDCGKKLNRAVQVMIAAERAGDTVNAGKLLDGIKAELADWFTADNDTDPEDKYFYYDEDMGTLFGFPQAYYTVDGMTDHAFHYGYFINAAAQVALRDKNFVAEYGNIIDELIGDMATTAQTSSTSRYPYIRQFDAWEGHSWASGHGDFGDGNNQESSSEAINGWAGLILYGQATGNDALTETGVYLYTTEVNSVYNYWFDIDGDVLNSRYRTETFGGMTHPYASMIWGGKYGYETWWTAEPLQTSGINILPNTAASSYLAKDKAYMRNYVEVALANENVYTLEDKDINRWNELYSANIAMYDPDAADKYFNPDCEAEAGDSKAHAWHVIKAMQKNGTPDLTITGNMPLTQVFEKNGLVTYTVYNPEDTAKTVTFSDGTSFTAEPNILTEYQKEKETTTADPTAPTTTVKPTQSPEEGFIRLTDDIWYKEVGCEIVGMNGPQWLPDPVLQWAFAGTSGVKVLIDDVETSSSPVVLVGNNIVKINPNALENDSYTNVKIQTATGNAEYIIKKGNPTPPTTTAAPTTTAEPTTTAKPTTTVAPTTTAEPTEEPTTIKPTEEPTTEVPTTVAPTTKVGPTTKAPVTTKKAGVKKPDKVKIKKIYKKKKSAKKLRMSVKKAKRARGYQVKIFTKKKNAKKVKKALVTKTFKKFKKKFTIKSKKLKKKKRLYVRVRAYNFKNGKKQYGKWSKVKKVKMKKKKK